MKRLEDLFQKDDMNTMTDKDSEGNQPVRAPFGPTSRSLPIALLRARESVMGPVRVMLQESNI
ncbi:MAG: hypothetical protein R3D29_09135, partial [Nitratireductor sp.]